MNEEIRLLGDLAKPCKFCGGKNETPESRGNTHWIRCLDCGAKGPYGTEETALKLWNGEAQ